jgi:cysteinyl-tRNA synthetase
LSDQLRDDILPFLGIQLEDKKPGEPASWKFVDKETLLKERQAKIDAKAAKEAEKIARAQLELKKKSTPPGEWFKVMNVAEYSKFDENGLPTHNNKDKELSEAIRNKLKKEQEKQKGVYEKWLV